MTSMRLSGVVVVFLGASLSAARFAGGENEADKNEPPWLWPPPQRLELLNGGMSLKGVSVLIPESAGRRVTAIASAVCRYAGFYNKGDMAVVRVKDVPDAPYMLLISPSSDAASYGKLAASVSVEAIPSELPDRRVWRRESYVLRIGPEGAALAAPEVWGLLQGARTFMQIAKVAAKTGKDALPSVSITDWPEMPEHHFCIVGPGRYYKEGNHKRVSAMLGELKYNHVMFALYDNSLTYPLHPEVRGSCPPGGMEEFAGLVRSMGLPTWPWMVSVEAGPHKGGGPIVYYRDTDEFWQAKLEMLDRALEVFRPDAMNVCMSEQYMAEQRWNGWRRSKKDWLNTLGRYCDFCLRRGVTPSIWGDCFRIGGNFDPWEKLLDTDKDGVRGIPRELIIAPWFYANEERYADPWEILAGKEFGFRVLNGCATWGTDGTFHAQHMVKYGKSLPLLWGLTAVVWGGGDATIGTRAVYRCAGSLWNSRLGAPLKEFPAEPRRAAGEDVYDDALPDVPAPEVKQESPDLAELLKKLGEKDSEAQKEAQEKLVEFGAKGAPAILAAMAQAQPAEPGRDYSEAERPLRLKLRKALDAICRRGRKNEIVRNLDIAAAQKFFGHEAADAREVAVELVATCAPKEKAAPVVMKGFKNAATRPACARAAGIAGIREAADELVAMVSNDGDPAENRLAAARALTQLRPAQVGTRVQAALDRVEDARLKEELQRAMASIRMAQTVEENRRIIEAAPYDERQPDFLDPLGLDAMLWREPKGRVSEYVAKLASDDFLVWEDAREELVGFGAGGAAEILAAMAKAPAIEPGAEYRGLNRPPSSRQGKRPEASGPSFPNYGAARPLRWKLEGVLSRICRDGRHGEAAGKLDVKAAEKHLADPCSYVRDIAAELLASCAPRNEAAAIILKGLKSELSLASCARAAGIAGFQEADGALIAIVSNEKAPARSRAAAAVSLGYLKPAAAGKPLLAALKTAGDVGLKKELIRTLSLVDAQEAEDEIARHLDKANDKFVRIRAVIALVNMKSAHAGEVEPWLAEDDRAMVELGCWALGKSLGVEPTLKVIERSIESQKNETLKKALKYQLRKQFFKRW